MTKEIKFKKSRVVYGMVFSMTMLCFSIWLIEDPDLFIRNQWIKAGNIRTLGVVGSIYFALLVCSFISIYPKKIAIIISNEYLIDHSKFESLGKINWCDISSIQRIKKTSLEIRFKESIFKNKKINFFKKVLHFMHNYKPNDTVIISSALLNCSIEELYKSINYAFKNSDSSRALKKVTLTNV